MNNKLVTVLGIVLGLAGVILALVAVGPDEWPSKFSVWASVIQQISHLIYSGKWQILSGLTTGVIIGVFFRFRWEGKHRNTITASDFERQYENLFNKNVILEMMIFGYTFETVRNYLKYEHLYKDSLHIRILNRSWKAEQADESKFNARIAEINIRQWKKSETMRQTATTPWTYKAKRDVRYYDFTHPIIKGVILRSADKSWAFFSFYEWQEVPPDGGSQFKGSNTFMVFLDSEDAEDKVIIRYLESQFELIWKYRSFKLEDTTDEYSSYLKNIKPKREGLNKEIIPKLQSS